MFWRRAPYHVKRGIAICGEPSAASRASHTYLSHIQDASRNVVPWLHEASRTATPQSSHCPNGRTRRTRHSLVVRRIRVGIHTHPSSGGSSCDTGTFGTLGTLRISE